MRIPIKEAGLREQAFALLQFGKADWKNSTYDQDEDKVRLGKKRREVLELDATLKKLARQGWTQEQVDRVLGTAAPKAEPVVAAPEVPATRLRNDLEGLVRSLECRKLGMAASYAAVCTSLAQSFGQDGGPKFESSSDLSTWIAYREQVRVLTSVIDELQALLG